MPKSDLKRIDQMADEEIDYTDIPPLTDEQLSAMKPLSETLPAAIVSEAEVKIHLDEDILIWLKEQADKSGIGSFQPLINTALREYIERQKEPLEKLLRRVIREELSTSG